MGDRLTETAVKPEERVQAKRLYLERLSVSKHLEDFHELWTTDEAVIWSTEPKKTSLEESRVLMGSILPNDINPDIDKFAIMLEGERNSRGDMKMIGLVGTNRWSSNSLGLETGYCLNISYWGCGYATEAFACFLEYFWSLEGMTLERRLQRRD
jgi:RimJ/RimL family protein N-acetyltransferase